MSRRAISAKIDTDIYERLAAAAERSDRSMSWIVETALENYLDQVQADEQAILDGIADLAAGRTLPHADVKAWASGIALPSRPREDS